MNVRLNDLHRVFSLKQVGSCVAQPGFKSTGYGRNYGLGCKRGREKCRAHRSKVWCRFHSAIAQPNATQQQENRDVEWSRFDLITNYTRLSPSSQIIAMQRHAKRATAAPRSATAPPPYCKYYRYTDISIPPDTHTHHEPIHCTTLQDSHRSLERTLPALFMCLDIVQICIAQHQP